MPASKAQQKAVAKYMKNNYDELKKGFKRQRGYYQGSRSGAGRKSERLCKPCNR